MPIDQLIDETGMIVNDVVVGEHMHGTDLNHFMSNLRLLFLLYWMTAYEAWYGMARESWRGKPH